MFLSVSFCINAYDYPYLTVSKEWQLHKNSLLYSCMDGYKILDLYDLVIQINWTFLKLVVGIFITTLKIVYLD